MFHSFSNKHAFVHHLLILIGSFFILNPIICSAEWYEDFTMIIKDPYAIGTGQPDETKHRILGKYKLAGFKRKVYAVIEESELLVIEKAGQRKYIRHRNVLDKRKAETWKRIFSAKADKGQFIPVIVNIAGLANVKIGITTLLLDYLLSTNSQKISTDKLSELMAANGEFIDYATIRRHNNHPYLYTDAFYHIKIGEEDRYYLIYSAILAVKVE